MCCLQSSPKELHSKDVPYPPGVGFRGEGALGLRLFRRFTGFRSWGLGVEVYGVRAGGVGVWGFLPLVSTEWRNG